MKFIITILFISGLLLSGCDTQNDSKPEGPYLVKEQISKFVPTELKYNVRSLDERQKIVVEKLYRASKIMDRIFLVQVYSENDQIKADLMAESKSGGSEEAIDQLELFNIMFGPFDRLEHERPFIGTKEKPLGANFYPEDLSKKEFENWINNHPEDEKRFHF